MKYAFIDRYARLSSPIHQLGTSTKLTSALLGLGILLVLLPLGSNNFTLTGLLAYAIIAYLVALNSKLPLRFLLSRSALVLPFSALIIVVNFLSGHFSTAQLVETLVKSLLSVLTLLLLTSTTPFHEIIKQLSHWGTPRLMIIILSFMYRYFFVLMGEIESLEHGIKTRYPSVAGWQKMKVYANIIGMLLIRSFERAEKVYQSMRMRGFTGELR